MLKFYVSGSPTGHTTHYIDWLSNIEFERVNALSVADVVVFTGGEDINPTLYKQPVGKWTWYNTQRDDVEVSDWKRAVALNKLCIGICRGGQLISALSGGSLIQHVSGHQGSHDLTFKDGTICKTSSIHHQMMYPFELPKDSYDLLAWSTRHRSECYLNGFDQNIPLFKGFVEPEVIWFKSTRGFAIQGHPEMMGPNTDFTKKLTQYFNSITENKYVRNSLCETSK